MGQHGVDHFQEACDVGTGHIIARHAVLLGGIVQVVENIHHNALQLGVHFLKGPAEPLGVLTHFQGRGGHAACIGGFAGAEQDMMVLEILGGVQSGGHIGALGHGDDPVGNQSLGILQMQLVLGGAGQGNVAFHSPDPTALVVHGAGAGLGILGEPGPADFLHVLQQGHVDAFRIIDPAGGIGAGDDLCPQLLRLFDGVGGYVACTGHGDGLAGKRVAVAAEHFLGQVQQTVACGLGPGL